MTKRCALCGDPAAVFTPTMPLCKRCRRDADEANRLDYPIDNAPYCSTCGDVLTERGTCPGCQTRALIEGHRRMVRVG